MKVGIHLTPEGHAYVAKGERIYAWHTMTSHADADGTYHGREDYTLLGELEVQLPSPEVAVHVALAELKRKEADIKQSSYDQLREIEVARAKLLSLTYEPVPAAAADYHTSNSDITDV